MPAEKGSQPRVDVREIRMFKMSLMDRELASEKLLTKLKADGVQQGVAERHVAMLLTKYFDN